MNLNRKHRNLQWTSHDHYAITSCGFFFLCWISYIGCWETGIYRIHKPIDHIFGWRFKPLHPHPTLVFFNLKPRGVMRKTLYYYPAWEGFKENNKRRRFVQIREKKRPPTTTVPSCWRTATPTGYNRERPDIIINQVILNSFYLTRF